MFEGIVEAAERIRGDFSVRAVVLRGEGKAFCAGLDWQFFMTADESARARMLERGLANLSHTPADPRTAG